MRKQLYLDIKERLKTAETAVGEPLFRHFDLWNQQVEFIEAETPFVCPAVFVEFDRIDWRTLGNCVQECTLRVRLHIVTEWYSDTADYSPTEDQALEYLDIIDRAVAVLQGFNTSYMTGWQRSASITNHDHERFVDSVEEYVCMLRDTSACRSYIPVEVRPVVTI
ncbi:MAG: hypothetical protein RRY55_01220 [Bacteroidales bacterium]